MVPTDPATEEVDIPEPDLSMELHSLLIHNLIEMESELVKKETQEVARLSEASPQDIEAKLATVERMWAAEACTEVAFTLRSFAPDISKEKLATDLLSIIYSDSVVGHLASKTTAALRKALPRDQRRWAASDVDRHLIAVKSPLWRILVQSENALQTIASCGRAIVQDPGFPTLAGTAAGCCVVGGVGGGAAGAVSGGLAGAVVGVPAAFLTFGLSIPVGFVVGAGTGLCVGAAAGSSAGLVGGGLIGLSAYRHSELRAGAHMGWAKVNELAGSVRDHANLSASYVKTRLVGGTGGTA